MNDFVSGLQLSERYFTEIVKPLLDQNFSGLQYSAALIGPGSEVLGYDTKQSSDHDWGPRVLIFVGEGDFTKHSNSFGKIIDEKLPAEFIGYPTRYELRGDTAKHRVELHTIPSFWQAELAFDPNSDLAHLDWLTFPEQKLLSLTSGKVFWDGLGELEKIRGRFSYYPSDVWLYLLFAQWTRIAQEEAFMGRAGDVGDELGSQLIAAGLVEDVMRLSFLMERKYAPYSKWFGTAFSQLESGPVLTPQLREALLADNWKEREAALTKVYIHVAETHNNLGITEIVEARVSLYHERPYQVLNAERFADALKEKIQDEPLRALKTNIGSVNQFADSTDLMEHPELTTRLRVLYQE